MDETEIVRVGRGGIGNTYTKEDIANMKKATDIEDLEAHITKQEPDSMNREISVSTSPKYAPTGRGGAGNFHETATSPNPELTRTLTFSSANTASIPKAEATEPSRIPTGRGGAGNWFESTHTREKRIAEEERRKDEERKSVEVMVRESIEKQLKKPEATYGCRSDRGVRIGKSRLGATLGDESLGS